MTEDTENKNETLLPEEVTPDLATLKAEIADLQKQNEDYLDSLQRERAPRDLARAKTLSTQRLV